MTRTEKALGILHNGTVIPASPLALNSNRQFDSETQRLLTKYYLNSGVGGIAVGVHTTQFAIRDPEINLLETVLETAADEIDKFELNTGKTIVKVAGVCGETKQAEQEAMLAKKYGYDAVLLSPGGLNHLSESDLLKRTRVISEIIPVIGFYLQPAVGGKVFSYNFWENFCEIDNVVAIKSAPFNRYYTLDVIRAAATSSRADKIAMYTGNDDNIVIDLITNYKFEKDGIIYEKSFVGGLLGHWSVWTSKAVEMFEYLKKAKVQGKITTEILELANQVTDVNAAFFDTANNFKGCIAGLHQILMGQGLMKGIWCLDPSETLSEGQLQEIDRVCKMYPHLADDKFISENIEIWKQQ